MATTTTTTTTYAPAADPGELLPPGAQGWSRDDWDGHYRDEMCDAYAASVIWASDDACLLGFGDLERLLEFHNQTVEGLRQDLGALIAAGRDVLPLRHAGQALVWLGY